MNYSTFSEVAVSLCGKELKSHWGRETGGSQTLSLLQVMPVQGLCHVGFITISLNLLLR